MRFSKQMVNAVGALTVVAVLVAGVMLVALPMYSQSRAMAGKEAVIATTNVAYTTEVDKLRSDQALMTKFEGSIDTLREEIPSVGTLDDVFEIVTRAALASGAVLESAISSPAQGWTARPDAVSVLEVPLEGVIASEPAVTEEAGAEVAAEDPGTDPAAAEPVTGDPAAGPEREVLFVIVALVDSSAEAAAFLDALRVGPRLIAVTHTELLPQDPGLPLRLTINALTFVRTED